MKRLFILAVALFSLIAAQAQTPITVVNADMEDLTPMAKNSSDKWAIKGFYLTDVVGTLAGSYIDNANSGLVTGLGVDGTQAFKITITQPDATSNTYNVVNFTTDPIDISNREFGKYTYKIYLKVSDMLSKNRPFGFTCIATDEDGADVTAFTAIPNSTDRAALNGFSAFNIISGTTDYLPLSHVVDVKANTNTDPNLGSLKNAKYLSFQYALGKSMAATSLITSYFIDNNSLIGPAEKTQGLNSVNGGFNVQIYPNPTKDVAQINCADGIDEVSLYSVTGLLINKVKVGGISYKLDISTLANGVYSISVKNNKGVANNKINKI